MMAVILLVLLLVGAVVCWLLTWLGLFGNWILLAMAAGYEWLLPDAWHWSLGWPVIAVLLVLAIAGEAMEFLASGIQTRRAGGSRRSAVLSLVGSVAGGVLGALVALPIPVVGSVIAALLGSVAGALLGGMAGEYSSGGQWRQSMKVGGAAATGRMLGTIGKSVAGGIMIAVLIAGLIM